MELSCSTVPIFLQVAMKTVVHLIWKELCGRKASFLLSVVAVTAAVAMCTALALIGEASRRETRRVMRDLGFNLRVIPRATDMDQFYLLGFSDQTMQENSLDELAKIENLSYNHLVAVLQGKAVVAGHQVLLMGISGERAPPGRKKTPMIESIDPGSVHVGSEIARQLQLSKGDTLQIEGHEFCVVRRMPEMGSIDDMRIIGSLSDVQLVLGLEGRINEIKAIDCLCLTQSENPRTILQAEIEQALPQAKVVMLSNIAEARARQRQTSDHNSQFVIAVVILVAAAWVSVMAVVNVRQRAAEIGLLRALGYGSLSITSLILGRAVLIGLIAAVAGATLGTWTATTYGPHIFQVTARSIQPQSALFWYALSATPVFVALASVIPAALAVVQDPAQVLRRQ